MYQIETEGDMLISAAISSSGECLAFGGTGGYVHLWAHTHEPSVNQMRQARACGGGAGAGAATATPGLLCQRLCGSAADKPPRRPPPTPPTDRSCCRRSRRRRWSA